jgi:hypothetical protein
MITPYGLKGIGYYPTLLGNPNMRYIAEWQGARPGGASIPFIVMAAITVAVCLRSRLQGARFDPFIASLALAMGLMGIQAIRYQIWFALVAALLIADLRGQLASPRPAQGSPLPRMTAALCVAAAAGAIAITATTPAGVFEQKTPPAALRATAAAAAAVQGPILTDDITGSALPWVAPQLAGRVAFDSRTEIYPARPFQDFVRFLTVSPHWRRALAGYDEISVSCRLGHAKLCQAIPSLHGWLVVYRTPAAVVAVRAGAGADA